MEHYKVFATLSYLIFFLPLLRHPKSEFIRYHANQGFLLFLTALALYFLIYVVGVHVPILGWFVILPFGSLGAILLVLWLMFLGMRNAWLGQMKPLPLIGRITLIR